MSLRGRPLNALAHDLAAGVVSSRMLIEAALEAIAEDSRAFTAVDAGGARGAADAMDVLRRAGAAPSPYAGIPVSVKDLFDIAGQTTAAGSAILRDAEPARHDAPATLRLRQAGFVFVGRTHMSEFAFSGLGLNPHAPPLPNALRNDCVPGGSSSGAAVSVALGQASAGLGTDTGGSVRIPAAFNGLVGFKPTQRRVSTAGVFPLCPSLDSVGPIAWTANCCRILDGFLAGEGHGSPPATPSSVSGLRLGVMTGYAMRDLDAVTATAFGVALTRLSAAGVHISTVQADPLDRLPGINAKGALANAEAYAVHRRKGLLDRPHLYDPMVFSRIAIGKEMSAADYLDVANALQALRRDMNMITAGLDAIILPTVAREAPTFAEVADADGFSSANALVLRNTAIANALDRCAVTLPGPDGVGVMLMGETMGDANLLRVAEALEPVLR